MPKHTQPNSAAKHSSDAAAAEAKPAPQSRLKRYQAALLHHYSAPQYLLFKDLRAGFIYFAVGLMSVYMANVYMQPSLIQECIVFAGLIGVGIGFILAMRAYLRLLITRLLGFFRNNK